MTVPDPFTKSRDFKVMVSFHPIGSAPRLKVSKFTVDGTLRISELTSYLSKTLKDPNVHVYVANSIELMDDQFVGDFVRIFGKLTPPSDAVASTGSINVHYSIGRAYL